MKNEHPGKFIRHAIEELGWTVTETAEKLNVSRQALTNLLSGKGGISAEMAVRLECVLPVNNGGIRAASLTHLPAERWLKMQTDYDLEVVSASVKKEMAQ